MWGKLLVGLGASLGAVIVADAVNDHYKDKARGRRTQLDREARAARCAADAHKRTAILARISDLQVLLAHETSPHNRDLLRAQVLATFKEFDSIKQNNSQKDEIRRRISNFNAEYEMIRMLFGC